MHYKNSLLLSLIFISFLTACTSSEENTCYKFDMRQCNLDPWSSQDNTLPIEESINSFLRSAEINAISVSYKLTDIATCLACSCPSGETITVTINEEDASKIELLDLLNLTKEDCG